MAISSIYGDIAQRTGGDIYVGVVGPVRTGKSTFIHKFLEAAVIPNIENEYDRTRAADEAPLSATGRTIMTTEPKFVPDEAVRIEIDGGTKLNVKLIDCVGYVVDGALGGDEGGEARMVTTPWSEEPMPFERAAELGTKKVISEHSTIGILVTTDGSITDIPRESYVRAEERAARELTSLGKPFAVVLNSKFPENEEARELAKQLEEKYSAPVALVNCTELNADDVREILGLVLGEFPVKELDFSLPEWCEALPREHRIHRETIEKIAQFTDGVRKLGDLEKQAAAFPELRRVSLNAGDGTGEFAVCLAEGEYYAALRECCELDIQSEKELFKAVCELAAVGREYRKIEKALNDVHEKGYGIVMPEPDDMELEEPRLTKQAGGWGVKVAAQASSIHMIRTELKTELCPVVGTEEQTEEVVKYLVGEYENDKDKLWESNMFGRSIYDMVRDGMNAKLLNLPDESREKLGETIERVVNEGANGLICILL